MDERGKKYLIKEDREFQSDLGIIKKEQMERATIGDTIITHLNKEFKVIKPTVNDFIDLMDRRCSILIQKDIGTVLARTGLGSGDRVIDAGTGAGAIALNFGNVVGEKGKVFTYEIREDFAEVAKKNIDDFGIKNIEVKNQNIKDGIDEEEIEGFDEEEIDDFVDFEELPELEVVGVVLTGPRTARVRPTEEEEKEMLRKELETTIRF